MVWYPYHHLNVYIIYIYEPLSCSFLACELGIKINVDSLRSIAQALRKHKGIRSLSLVGCSLTDEAMDLLVIFIKSNGHIEELDVSQNKITSTGTNTCAHGHECMCVPVHICL